jgi:hypothetical protein
MATASEERPRRWVWLWAACYVVLIGTIVWSLFYARRSALAESGDATIVRDWQVFREDIKQQQAEHPGPVERRVPKSLEPPALVLMRDYFGVSLGGAVVFTSVLYWVIAWLVMGAMATGPVVSSNDPIATRRR